MKEYYTLKEVLFGLRNEQLRIEKELYSLRKMININGNERYKGSKFLPINTLIQKYELLYYKLMINYTTKEKIYSLFRGENLFNFQGHTLRTVRDCDGKHILRNESENLINDDMIDEFNSRVDKILNDRFIKEVDLFNRQPNYCINLDSSHFIYSEHDYKTDSFVNLKYAASSDSILVSTTGKSSGKYLNDFIYERLNYKVPKNVFPEYIQSIIDTNEETKKELIMRDNKIKKKKAEFYINDERDVFVLVKKI